MGTPESSNHGIDYWNVPLVAHSGFVPDPYSMMQEIGRTLRASEFSTSDSLLEEPSACYLIVFDLSSYYYHLVRAHGQKTHEGRKTALHHLDCMVKIFLGSDCVMYSLAIMFGNPDKREVPIVRVEIALYAMEVTEWIS